MGTGCHSTGREADHTTPYSAEVKNKWSCPSYAFVVCIGRTFILLFHTLFVSVHEMRRISVSKNNQLMMFREIFLSSQPY